MALVSNGKGGLPRAPRDTVKSDEGYIDLSSETLNSVELTG